VNQSTGPAEAPAVRNYGNSSARPGQGPEPGAWEVQRWLWANTGLPGLAKCHRVRWRTNIEVLVSMAGDVHYRGFCRCHSVWACPLCAPSIRQGRARLTGAALRPFVAAGGGVLHSTYTLPHNVGDRLVPLFGAVTRSWDSVTTDKTVRQLRADLGLHFLRSTEVTVGENGWHPHLHVGEVCKVPLTREQVVEYRREAFRAWCAAVERHGYRVPSERYGLSMVRADAEMGDYVSKVQGLADELHRMDRKSGKTEAPFSVLRRAVAGDERAAALWSEYELGTKGRRALFASRNFFKVCPVPEVPDDVLLAAIESEASVVVGELRPDMAHLLVNHPRGFEGFAEMVGPGTSEAWSAALAWLSGTAPWWLSEGGWERAAQELRDERAPARPERMDEVMF
jgi:hypothetical protein